MRSWNYDATRRGLLPAGLVVSLASLFWTGCQGPTPSSERQARRQLQELGATYRPEGRRPVLPPLDATATLGTLLAFAVLNHPQVEAAYFDYVAAVERITVERSLPDPRLTLELDIQDVVMTLMPGLMAELPWVQRLRIQADQASAESLAKFHALEAAVLRTAYEVKRPYYQLHFLQDRIRIHQATLRLVGELEQNARAQT
jgi:outer membrane protein TolC